MIWKDWNWKLRMTLIFVILSIMAGPLVDFFEHIPFLSTILKPFFFLSHEVIRQVLIPLINLDISRNIILSIFLILDLVIYIIIGYFVGFLIDKYKK